MTRDGNAILLGLAWRECRTRRVSLGLTIAAVAAGVGVWIAVLAGLDGYDRRLEAVLHGQEAALAAGLHDYDQALSEAMRRLGFNLLLLPAEQPLGDFYEQGFAAATLPESVVETLAGAGAVTVAQVVPVLRRKVRWEERGWTVLLQAVGTPRCLVPREGALLEVDAVPRGSLDIGYEIQRGMQLQPGARVQFLGREFTVRACRPEAGTEDDITVWLNLAEAQERLELPGRISEIRALGCRAAWNQVSRVRAEIAAALPGVTVVEKSGETLALAAARDAFEKGQRELLEQRRAAGALQRRQQQRLALALGALALALAAGVTGLTGWSNARDRRGEIGLWTALGASPAQVLRLFAWRAALAGLAGAALGLALGCPWWGWPGCRLLALWAALALGVAWIAVLPALVMAGVLVLRLDPAAVLKNEV